MGADNTRFSFDPIRGFSGLHKQQGRVSLDWEFNEFEEILDRRGRATTFDIVGGGVTPATTPNGFLIGGTLAAPTIGVGRAYVDGILAECFGDLTTTDRDDVLGRVHGSAPLGFSNQPFFYPPPSPTSPMALPAAAGDILYLDVWQREVTVFEDDDLREVALNGPDTATRVQTAWQVGIAHGAGATGCPTPLPASITAPSTARLTAQATPAAPAAGPCVINPAGGYTGLENRLYRVEIHRAGTLSGVGPARAQFKWSRDNASLAARVLSITPVSPTESIITVSSTGRDAWMRFEHDDHIELLDDFVEFAMRETGTGGPMARILTVNHATGEIHVDQDLTAFAVVAARHPRIRRWDILNAAEPLTRDVNNGTPIPLEQGITVTFGGSGTDTLHAGDYWVFAARTADGTIDTVVNEPPRGILHHYYKLGVATGGAPPFTDCRVPWPPPTGESCCTVVVHPGESIQAAIDSLPPAGGCVCLKAGIHDITATLLVNRSKVHLHGESGGAEIHSPGLVETLHIGGSVNSPVHDVMVESLRFVVDSDAGSGGGAVIGMEYANRVEVRETELFIQYSTKLPGSYVGLHADNCNDVLFCNNVVEHALYGAMIEDVGVRAWVNDNRFMGLTLSVAAFNLSIGQVAVQMHSDIRADHRAERNVIRDFVTGVSVPSGSQGARVIENRILRSDGELSGAMPSSAAALRTYLDDRYYAIDLSAGQCVAQGNYIDLKSSYWGGIRVATTGAVVSGNTLVANLSVITDLLVPASIYCTSDAKKGQSGSGSTISDNLLQGPQTGIVVSRVTGVEVRDNRVDGEARAWYGVRVDDASYTTVAGNLIAALAIGCYLSDGDHNILCDSRIALTLIGVVAQGETDLCTQRDEITGAAWFGMALVDGSGDLLVGHNRIVNCGWMDTSTGGIFASFSAMSEPSTDSLRIESCEIVEPGVAPDGTLAGAEVYGIIGGAPNCQIVGNRVVSTNQKLIDAKLEHRALLLVGPLSYAPLPIRTSSAVISNNVFRGPGKSYLVECMSIPFGHALGSWFHKIVFCGNYCDHYADPKDARATALLAGRNVAANANQISAARGIFSIDCAGSVRNSIVGNVTSGDIVNFATALPSPPSSFNIIV